MMTTTMASSDLPGVIELLDEEFRLISGLVYERFGINLTEKKKALVRSRLNSLVKSGGFSDFKSYYQGVVDDPTDSSLLSLVDRISTNHSYFFREAEHFELLTGSVLPEICGKLERSGTRDLRIWCAGSAAGEEPYTLAMVLADYFGSDRHRWDIGLLATDISVSALDEAVEGIYSARKLEGMPEKYRRFLKKVGTERYEVVDSIKKMVLFKRLNLMRTEYPFKGKFHVVFCRNVMIYFDRQTRNDLVARFHHSMHDGGYLIIGHSETLGKDLDTFRYMQPTVYQKW